jgi:hypothetical protein
MQIYFFYSLTSSPGALVSMIASSSASSTTKTIVKWGYIIKPPWDQVVS